MSISLMAEVWRRYPRGGSEKLVLLALADWANDDGGSLYPSMSKIARKTCCSESQARRHVHSLVERGLLQVVANPHGGRPGATPHYQIDVSRLMGLAALYDDRTGSASATPRIDATPSTHARDGLHGCARRVAPMRETGSTSDTLTIKEPSKNHQRTTTPKSEVLAVFDYWQRTMNHHRALLDKKRESAIRAALALGYSTEDLCKAIDGCAADAWSMGKNSRGVVYDALTLILRDADHIDKFIRFADKPPTGVSGAGTSRPGVHLGSQDYAAGWGK